MDKNSRNPKDGEAQTPDQPAERRKRSPRDRRRFLRDLGYAGIGVGLGHFFLLGPGTRSAFADVPDYCPTGNENEGDHCDLLDGNPDHCPGGKEPQDYCPATGVASEDMCPTGKNEAAGGGDKCSPEMDTGQDRCDHGRADEDACSVSGGAGTDYCPGGYAPEDNCVYQEPEWVGDDCGAGDAGCDVSNSGTDTCPASGENDNCYLVSGSGKEQSDTCKTVLEGGIPVSTYDECGSDVLDGTSQIDECGLKANTDAYDECLGGINKPGGAGDVCDAFEADECPDGVTVAGTLPVDYCPLGNIEEDACPGAGDSKDVCPDGGPTPGFDECIYEDDTGDKCLPPGSKASDLCSGGFHSRDECPTSGQAAYDYCPGPGSSDVDKCAATGESPDPDICDGGAEQEDVCPEEKAGNQQYDVPE